VAKDETYNDQTQSFTALTPGTKVLHFRILEKIGSGGMGEVYLASDTKLNRKVALKFLAANLCDDEVHSRRFALEAQTAAGLDHPNILTVYEVGKFNDRPFFSMQFLEGESLRDILSTRRLPLHEVLEIFMQICRGLQEAHLKNVIHRDLKPANVIISPDGRAKILDFGLAKTLSEHEYTQAGTLLGTVSYMSPEQLDAQSIDHRSDIFSAGILFYEMLTGVNPFVRESMAATIHAIVLEEANKLFAHRHTIPSECQSILDMALAKKPEDRYRSISDLLSDLEHLRSRYSAVGSDLTSRLYIAPASIMPDRLAIAVLPFANMSPDPDNEYFADGLSEELLNVLTKIGQFRVAARTSSFAFKNSKKDIRAIGRDLNVSAILEGSVRKSESRIRVTVQLVKVEDGYHLWSETYDRTFDDILVVQDDIAKSVVHELRIALLGEEAGSSSAKKIEEDITLAVKGRSENPEAHRQYLLGKYYVERLNRLNVNKAKECFQGAIDIDPLHSQAWAGLSRVYQDEAGHGWTNSTEGFDRARAAVRRALEIEPNLAEGHMLQGLIHMSYDWDWKGALAAIKRALELAPGKASVLRTAAHLASNLNQLDEAIGLMRQAVVLDPLSSAAFHSLGIYCYSADRLEEASGALETALELNSNQIGLWFDYARVKLAQGLKNEAIDIAGREVFEPFRLLALSVVHHARGNAQSADSALQELIEKYSEDGAYQIAEAFAFRSQSDQAFEWLERAYAQRDPGLPEMRTEPMLRGLHGHMQWRNLMERLGFSN
jgi:serine/threonine protein kinase/Tfp pilus assembly protein PilF